MFGDLGSIYDTYQFSGCQMCVTRVNHIEEGIGEMCMDYQNTTFVECGMCFVSS